MKKKLDINQIEVVKPPFFKKDSLVFASSHHDLRISDRHYRCSRACNGECDKNEPQLKIENVERNFCRYAQKFALKAGEENEFLAEKMIKSIVQDAFNGESLAKISSQEEVINSTIDAINADIKNSKTVSKKDIEDIQNVYTDSVGLKKDFILQAIIASIIRSFSMSENEVEMARQLAKICKKIYITNTGTIKEILLERWGWYILHFIDKKFPGYLKNIKNVKILNETNDPILSLDLEQAMNYFKEDNFQDAINSNSTIVFKDSLSILKNIGDMLSGGKSIEEQQKIVKDSLSALSNPIFQIAMTGMQMSDARLRSKIHKKDEKKRKMEEDKSDKLNT